MVLRCVIVDDNPDFLQAARAMLERDGLEVVGVASTGAEALRGAAVLHRDVTLVDVDLGEDSGFDVLRSLVEDAGLDPGQLILISAHADADIADLIEESPAIGFVGKQVLSAEEIERLLHRARGEHAEPGEMQLP